MALRNAAHAVRPELPRRLMRRTALVAGVMSAVVLVAGMLEADDRIGEEVHGAMRQASWIEHLSALRKLPDAEALATLEVLRSQVPLRHLGVEVRDGQGRMLMVAGPAPGPDGPTAWLALLHERLATFRPPPPLSWKVDRPDGEPWTVQLVASAHGERREAMSGLLRLMAATLGGLGLLLWLMSLQVRQTVQPLRTLLEAIGRLDDRDRHAVRGLPPMPLPELQTLATALVQLADQLDGAQEQRRQLAQQVLTLQEDERQRLARELHDELGQHLTALRADLAWLDRPGTLHGEAADIARSAVAHAQHIQQELRALLARLRPMQADDVAPAGPDGGGDLANLARRLEQLVQGWRSPAMRGLLVRLALTLGPPGDARQVEADDLSGNLPALPAALGLTLYRLSQEALTNVARHAQAQQALLCLAVVPQGGAVDILWSVTDDGIGISDWAEAVQRGSGLAGLQERVWAQGGEFALGVVEPGADRPGLRLTARFTVPHG